MIASASTSAAEHRHGAHSSYLNIAFAEFRAKKMMRVMLRQAISAQPASKLLSPPARWPIFFSS